MRYQRLHEGAFQWLATNEPLYLLTGSWDEVPFVQGFLHSSVSNVGVSGTRLSCLIKQLGGRQHLSLDGTPPLFFCHAQPAPVVFFFLFFCLCRLLAPWLLYVCSYSFCKLQRFFSYLVLGSRVLWEMKRWGEVGGGEHAMWQGEEMRGGALGLFLVKFMARVYVTAERLCSDAREGCWVSLGR